MGLVLIALMICLAGCTGGNGAHSSEAPPSSAGSEPKPAPSDKDEAPSLPPESQASAEERSGGTLADFGYQIEIPRMQLADGKDLFDWSSVHTQSKKDYAGFEEEFTIINIHFPDFFGQDPTPYCHLRAYPAEQQVLLFKEKEYTPAELSDYLIYADEKIQIYRFDPLLGTKSAEELISDKVRQQNESVRIAMEDPTFPPDRERPDETDMLSPADLTYALAIARYFDEHLPDMVK